MSESDNLDVPTWVNEDKTEQAMIDPSYKFEMYRIQAADLVTRGMVPTDSVEVFLNNVDAVVAYLANGTKPEPTNDQSL